MEARVETGNGPAREETPPQASKPTEAEGAGRKEPLRREFRRFDFDDYYADAFGAVLDDCMGLCCR